MPSKTAEPYPTTWERTCSVASSQLIHSPLRQIFSVFWIGMVAPLSQSMVLLKIQDTVRNGAEAMRSAAGNRGRPDQIGVSRAGREDARDRHHSHLSPACAISLLGRFSAISASRESFVIVFGTCAILCLAVSVSAQMTASLKDSVLEQIAFIHGGTGPFAVAGYRIGERALKELNLPRESFSLEVVHKTPEEVQWSCISDGVQAATGASPGKLNLRIQKAPKDSVETIIRNRKTGQGFVFRLSPDFVKRYLDLPHEKLAEAGKEVLSLRDDQIFAMKRMP